MANKDPAADSRASDAVAFMRMADEAESQNRVSGLEDLKFRFGEQWPAQLQNSRRLEARPMFTINETDSYCRQVVNSIRQMRPRGKAHPVSSTSNVKTAKVMTGIGRHIEVHSDAANAYDLGVEFAVTIGWGYWRVANRYIADMSRDQDIYVDQIENPFAVYFDPNSKLPDGSDAERVLITDTMPKADFQRMYPGAQMGQSFREGGAGDSRTVEWVQKDNIRLGEYFTIEQEKKMLVYFSDGSVAWEDKIAAPEIMRQVGISIIGDRQSWRKKVLWTKVTAFETLEEVVMPGRYIPVIPVYGVNLIIEGRRRRYGMVRFARDPQMLINFSQTSIVEVNALAPKAKWLIAEGQDEGYENEWAQANNSARPLLHYKTTDVEGKDVQPPSRIQSEAVPQGLVEQTMMASQNLQRVLGMFDPVNLKHTGPKSGEAIRQEMGQSEQANYHFYDNLTRSINHTWRIFLDWAPEIYDTQRVMRIIGDDGKPDLVTINERKTVEGVEKVLNDVRVGDYDVVMETGPGYNTKRQEAVANFQVLMGTPLGEEIAKVGADLIVRMYDFDGAEALADRLAAANPLAQIDDKSEIPPAVQMKMKAMQDQIQKLEGLLKQAGMEIKYKGDLERFKQGEETRREHMRMTTKAHDVNERNLSMQHSTETKALTSQNVEEIKGIVQLLLKHIDTSHLEREIEARNVEQQQKFAENAAQPEVTH